MHRKYLTPDEIRKLSPEEHLELLKEKKTPLYTPDNIKCIHSLYYDWTGWTSQKAIFPDTTFDAVKYCTPLCLNDGFKIKKCNVKNDIIQILFEVKPEIAPVLLTKRVKGRLDNALRKLGTPVKFSRKVGFRCLGENTREVVNNYVMKQVSKSEYALDHLCTFRTMQVDEQIDHPIPEYTSLKKKISILNKKINIIVGKQLKDDVENNSSPTDNIKKLNSEKTAEILSFHYKGVNGNERGLISDMLKSSGSIKVDNGILRISIGGQSSPDRTRMLKALCNEITVTAAKFPGTELRMVFDVADNL